jgi:hypothetical protein
MALTLIKEDGTGRTDANAYAAAADCDAYHDGHLYATAWTGATQAKKEAALVMATRLIDSQFQFNGCRAHSEQALQWPREKCPDPDASLVSVSVLGWVGDNFVEPDLVPAAVVRATCEMARELLIADRTAAPAGEGIGATQTSQASHTGTSGTSSQSSTTYSKSDTRQIISRVARAMLAKYGALIQGGSGSVRLVRA